MSKNHTPDGLSADPVWVSVGGAQVWRGYDPDNQPVHAAGEAKFIAECDARRLQVDRCSCGGLGAWDETDPDVTLDHYPAEFLDELPHGGAS